MKYVIVTTEWCLNHGIIVPAEARKSLDGTKVIFHEEMISPVLRSGETIKSYLWDTEELHEILNSEEWTIKENLNYDI